MVIMSYMMLFAGCHFLLLSSLSFARRMVELSPFPIGGNMNVCTWASKMALDPSHGL